MARTTVANIKAIIEVDLTIIAVDADMDAFIDVANELVTEMCTGSNGPTTAYSAARLELIERWLAAHFYAIRDPRVKSEKAGPVGVNYQEKVDLNLKLTSYGQQAMMLDTNGGLRSIDQNKAYQVQVLWLGTTTTASP
tara:strand:- start:20659 stop:21072 length:414 start_codon:yes stop_codon:yes gene_type:complete